MVVEETMDHRAIFGSDSERVNYFSSLTEMLQRTSSLLSRIGPSAKQMAVTVQKHII